MHDRHLWIVRHDGHSRATAPLEAASGVSNLLLSTSLKTSVLPSTTRACKILPL